MIAPFFNSTLPTGIIPLAFSTKPGLYCLLSFASFLTAFFIVLNIICSEIFSVINLSYIFLKDCILSYSTHCLGSLKSPLLNIILFTSSEFKSRIAFSNSCVVVLFNKFDFKNLTFLGVTLFSFLHHLYHLSPFKFLRVF